MGSLLYTGYALTSDLVNSAFFPTADDSSADEDDFLSFLAQAQAAVANITSAMVRANSFFKIIPPRGSFFPKRVSGSIVRD